MTKKDEVKKPETTKPAPEKKSIVALTADFGTVYIKADKTGAIMRPIKADISLFEKLGHLYSLPGKGWKGKQRQKKGDPATSQYPEDEEQDQGPATRDFSISSAGYTQLNKVAGITILSPQAVIVDGKERPNPFIERDPETKAITAVNLRKIGFGYTPAGTLVAVDKTLFYNIYTYFIQSIQAKMKRQEWKDGKPTGKKEFPDCAVYGIKDKTPTIKGSWAFFPTQPPLGLWINYEDQAILDCLEEHTQRQRFGDRIAQTIVDRNILKDHPAIGIARVIAKSGIQGWMATATVYGYRHDAAPADLGKMLAEAEHGSDPTASGPKIERKTGVVTDVDEGEEKAALEDVADTAKTDEEPTAEAEDDQALPFEEGKK